MTASPRCASTAHVLVEPRHRTFPRFISRGFVIALRRCIVVEAVHGAWINMTLVRGLGTLECALVLGPRGDQAGVFAPVVHEDGGLDLRHVRSHGRAAVERNCGSEIRPHPHGKRVSDAATETETG